MLADMSGPRHCIAVIGGAVAGAEVAGRLADAGVQVVVFDQNPRPYGKIEDGLPRWHVELRKKEYQRIDAQLAHPNVRYVPKTRIGKDLDFRDLVEDWGFTGVVLANGAWRARPLPVEGADEYVGRGLVYQNPLIVWFNHCEEPGYAGQVFDVRDGALVVGGGLASIDVAKVLMLETTRAALRERGIEVGTVELEVRGIPRTLAAHGLRFEELGLSGCTIFYRRRGEDMPLVEIPEGAGPEREAKVRRSREKLLEKAMEKYRFRLEPLCMPDALIVEDGQLVGLRFRRTRMLDGRPRPTEETFERRGSCVVSSIGSIPEPIGGIPMRGELFDFVDWELGRLADYPTVFSAGNIVTGKGNIVASRKHARGISEAVIEAFLGLGEAGHRGEEDVASPIRSAAARVADRVAGAIASRPPLEPDVLRSVLARVEERQRAVGYGGSFPDWIRQVTPPCLE